MAELEAAPEDSLMRIGKRCYVGNLAWKTSWQDLKDTFRECGTVVYANVMRDDNGRSKGWGIVEFDTPEEAVDAVDRFNGHELEGRKILVREDREDRDVKQFNKENGIEHKPQPRGPRQERRNGGGRGRGEGRGERREEAAITEGLGHMSLAEGQEGPGEGTGTQVVVQGIPWKYTWRELKPMFSEFGAVKHADVVFGRDGRSRGYGIVQYEQPEAAQAAIAAMHGTELEGRTLTVKLDKFS